jgi:hypothetical protein
MAHAYINNGVRRAQFIAEKDALVREAEKKGLEYVRTPGEYGHMVKDVKAAMSVYISAMFRENPELVLKVGSEQHLCSLGLIACTIACHTSMICTSAVLLLMLRQNTCSMAMSTVLVSLQVRYGSEMSAEAVALGCDAEVILDGMIFADGTNYANRCGAETMVYASLLELSEMVILGAKAGKDGEASMRADFCSPPGGGVDPLFAQLEALIIGESFVFNMDPEVFNGRTGKMRVKMRTNSLVLDQPASLAVAGGGKMLLLERLMCHRSHVP